MLVGTNVVLFIWCFEFEFCEWTPDLENHLNVITDINFEIPTEIGYILKLIKILWTT